MVLLPLVAMANEPVLSGPVEPYPTELPDRSDPYGRWARADRQGARATRMGAMITIGAASVTAGSMGLMALEDELGPYVAGTGGWLFVGSVPVLIAGPPVVLGGSLRSRRALKERGVRVSALPGAFGWTLYGLTPLFLSVQNDQSAFGIASYGGAIALGLLQSQRNERARRIAGLPDPRADRSTPVVVEAPQLEVGLQPLVGRERGLALVGRF